jgi:nitroimidazol reductase NimA-like FMN-containing flavoprotein (pyridoxamine 5'-phosphate oxidase superfamily)
MPVKGMTTEEIDQFLTCARVGRLGLIVKNKPYVVPVGFAYADGKILFHTCSKGMKISGIKTNPNVCFEVDETISDATMSKSVILFGTAEIIDEKSKMIPHLQRLIDKYRVPMGFDEYMSKPGKNREKELDAVRICVITPKKITGKKLVPRESGQDST